MSVLDNMRERRAAAKQELDALLAKAETETRNLNDDESTIFDTKVKEIREADKRIKELEELLADEKRAAVARAEVTPDGEQRTAPAMVEDPPIYLPGGQNGNSYFRDMGKRALGQPDAHDAVDRLVRNSRRVAAEQRALGNTNTTGGSGGEFAPPQWLINEYIDLARPGRVTADLFTKGEVPYGVSSINLPKLLTGTTVALQTTQNSTLAQTDLTTGYVSTGFATVGGKQVVSQQLLDQTAIPFDRVILADLAAAYAQQIGSQVLTGAGTGTNNNAVVNGLANAAVPAGNQIAFTSATPTPQQFYGAAAAAYSAFVTSRYAPPTVWLMHPRRYFWLLSKSDSSGRPLAVPTAVAQNPMATVNGAPATSGYAGEFLGLPVALDPNLPITGGAGTNQDTVYLLKADDLWLFESPPQVEAFREPYADSVGVLFRMVGYLGTILNRRATSIATISGTGLVTPTFG